MENITSSYSEVKEMYSLQITRRGAAPGGGGEVHFRCPVRQKLRPIQLRDPGKIKRIRGTAYPFCSQRAEGVGPGLAQTCSLWDMSKVTRDPRNCSQVDG